MPGTTNNRRRLFAAPLLIAMLAAAFAGWQYAAMAPPSGEQREARPRVAVLPFVDPETGDDTSFNQTLAAAFSRALTLNGADALTLVRADITARMVAQGMSPAAIAARTRADFLLAGGHRESDHGTVIELFAVAGEQSLLRRDFDIDETRPAHAPAALIAEIVEAIQQATQRRP